MTNYSWKSVASADWNTANDWTPAGGPPNAANADATIGVAGAYTVTIATAESFLVDSLTFGPGATGALALNGTLTLGGTQAEMTQTSGTVKLAGTINGGTLVVTGGVLNDTGTGVVNSAAIVYGGGTVTVATGKVLTFANAITLDSGAQINGAGTLATTGTTSIIGTPQLDGGLVWNNTGTVLAAAPIYTGIPSGTGKVTINNQAGGNFDLTADGEAFLIYSASTLALSNAGTLAKTGGTGTSNIDNALTNTGTLTATSGTLELDAGGTLGGVVTETTTGAVTLGTGLFALTGTVNGAGTLTVDSGATLAVTTVSQTIADAVVLDGEATIAGGKTLTLSGAVTLGNGSEILGPGTLATTGTTTIAAGSPYSDGSLVWDNTGTVLAGAAINTGYPSATGKVTIANLSGGNFDLTADGQAFYIYSGSTLALSNAGTLAKTGGTGTSNIANALTNTGTLTTTSGTLELDGGGTLGGVVTETTTGAVTLGAGLFTLTGTVNGPGTLTVDNGATLAVTTVSETIADAVVLAGSVTIASGKVLTLSGPLTLENAAQITGPGTLATSGVTSIVGTPYHDGSLVWDNTGTVLAGVQIYTGYPSGTGKVTIANQAGGNFDLTADGAAFYITSGSTLALSNAGTLAKTGGSGTSYISSALTNTGTLTATSGTLELDAGGTLGGAVTETTTGAVTLGGGLFTLTGTVNGPGTLTVDSGATLAVTTVSQTIADAVVLNGEATIASGKTLTLSGPVTLGGGSEILGPGTLDTTGTTNIGATPYTDGSVVWDNSGTVLAGAQIYTGYPSGTGKVTIANQSGGNFDLTADGQAFYVYSGSTLVMTNAGVLAKTGGTGTSDITAAVANSGTITATSGTLELDGGGTLAGVIGATGAGALALSVGSFVLGGAAQTISGALALNGGTVGVGSGKTLTLTGAVAWQGGDLVGPGTLATTGTTTIDGGSAAFIDGGLTWNNSGTVLDDSNIYDGVYSASGLSFAIANVAAGVFDFTTDGFYAFNEYSGATATFTNAGLLEKTAGTGIAFFDAALNNTGTVTASSGTLDLLTGGVLGGVIGATGAGEIAFGSGTFTLPGPTQTITGAVWLDGGVLDIATSQKLTLTGAVTWSGGDVVGPGTLATTGTTTIDSNIYIDGGLTWTNSGTVFAGSYVYDDAYLESSTLTNAVVNQATGVFDFTADGFNAFYNEWSSAQTNFTNAGLLEKTAGTGTVFLNAALTNTGTIAVSSGVLDLNSGGTLGGLLTTSAGGNLTFGGGAFLVTGPIANAGEVDVYGGSVAFGVPTETIANTVGLYAGALDIASGQTVTLTGAVTWSGGDVAGPGTLATTGTTLINSSASVAYLDGGLTWTNSGTVFDSYNMYVDAYLESSTLTNSVINQASGIFDFTADGFNAFYNTWSSAQTNFTNAGLLEKTAGTGSVDFAAMLNNTGTVSVSSGVLNLLAGGTLGGLVTTSAGGNLTFGGGAFLVTGALANGGEVDVFGGSVAFSAPSVTIANTVGLYGGELDIASGQTVTLTGAVTWSDGDVVGPGTLATTGTTTINSVRSVAYLGGGLTWTNSGTVLDSYYFYVDSNTPSNTLTNTVVNQATGIFDFTADGFGAFNNFWSSAQTTFINAGLLEKTGGTTFIDFSAALTNTGTVAVSSGTLDLTAGGTLGGVIGASGTAAIELGGGTFTLSGATQTITGAVLLSTAGAVDLASGQTLTLSGPVAWNEPGLGAISGPGTLATTGTTTISGSGAALDGSATWTNSGTVFAGALIYTDYPSGAGTVTIDNLAGGVFDITVAEQVFVLYGGTLPVFNNAGLLEKFTGAGVVTFNAALNNTGTVTTTAGTLDLDGGGTLNGTIGGTGSGVVWLDNGGSFVTTGTLTVLDAGASNDLRIVNGATLTDNGVINDSGHFEIGNGSGASALVIASGASFDFTSDDGQIVNGVSATINNVGTLAKTGGTGTSTVGISFTNSGTVDVASGTLKLAGAAVGSGRLQIEAGKTLELANGGVANNNTIDFNGLGATLKIDTNSTVNKSIIGLGGGSRIDLAAASSVAAVINGNTLTITPTGSAALKFISTSSLAGLHLTTGSDGGTGTVVTLYNEAAASPHTPEPVAFGNVHFGATEMQALTVTNTAPAGSYTENLDATLTSSGTGFTASGSFTGLGGGITNSTSLDVVLNTMNTGTIAGTGTLTLASDGAGIDGFGTTALPTQTVNVSGAVYAYAAPILSATTLNYGATRVGLAAITHAVTLADGSSANAYQERLVYSTGAAPAGFSISNGSGTIASGGSVLVGATLTTGTAGDFTGTNVGLALTSTGVGTSGLADTPLTGKTLTLNGKVYAPAVASFSAGSVNFGAVHVGDGVSDMLSQNLTLTNAASGALTDIMTGGTDTLGGNYAGPVGLSLGGGLAAGASTTVSFGLNTATSGAAGGSVAFGFTSHDADLTDIAINGGTIGVTGSVYAYAASVLSGTTLNFGATRVGIALIAQAVTLADGSSANAYQESLVYATGAAPAEFSVSNGSGTIASGGSATVGVTLATGTAGDFTGTNVGLALTSTGVGTSGLADTPLTGQTLTLNGKVYAAAVASFSAGSVNFGVVHTNTLVSQTLTVTNTASGALTDVLTGLTGTPGGGYSGPVGVSIGSGLTAGASGTVSFGLNTTASGVFNGDAAFSFTSHDGDQADLTMINGGTVAVSATVDNYATETPEKVGGVGTFTGSNTSYALNLGTILQGGTALAADLGVLNAATGLADLLSGSFTITGTGASAFTNTGFSGGFSGLGAGQDERNQVITLNTGTAGAFSETITVNGTGTNANYSGTLTTETITVTGTIAVNGTTYTLTAAPTTIIGGVGNDTIVAKSTFLNSHDTLDGGGGTNMVLLSGAGSFDLGAPAELANIQSVAASEGQTGTGGLPAGVQTVYMRNGANLTLNVASGTPNPSDPNPETITIYGAAANDVINLGAGTDTVTLGGAGETVNGGGGIAIVNATSATAGALITNVGTTGTATLTIAGGGTSTLNAADTNIIVKLSAAGNLTLSHMSFITADGSTGTDTITAMAQGQTLTGGGGADTLTGYSGFGDIFLDTSAHLNTTTLKLFGGSDLIDLTDLNSGLAKPLTYKGTASSGTLTVSDGTHIANIKLTGSYSVANFHLDGSDGHSGTLINFVSS